MKHFSITQRCILALLVAAACTGGAHAASLELDDCDVINGKKSAAQFKAWQSENTRLANAGEQDAIRMRAAVAGNRLACFEEEASGSEEWGMIQETDGAGNGDVTVATSRAGMPDIAKKPAALKALKDAVRFGHQAGAFDPGYRTHAAETVARYAAVLPNSFEEAYSDAAGAYEFDCVLKRRFGRRDPKTGCAMVRPVRAQLMTRVAPDKRAAIDAAARAWAAQLPTKGAD